MSMQYLLDFVKTQFNKYQSFATHMGFGDIDSFDRNQVDDNIRKMCTFLKRCDKAILNEKVDTEIEACIMAAVLSWRVNKQVYSFEQDFMNELVKTPLDFKLEPNALCTLPYNVFAIEVGDKYAIVNIDVLDVDGTPSQLNVVSPNNENSKQVFVMVLPLNSSSTIEHIIHTNLRYDRCGEIGEHQLTEAVQATLYLAAENAKIVENTYQKTIYKKPNHGSRIKDRYAEIQKWDCGVRVNEFRPKPSLLNAANVGCKVITPTGKTQAPCWRRAHWQTYWTGKGRTIPKLNWKQPYRTHEDEPIPVTKSKVAGGGECSDG